MQRFSIQQIVFTGFVLAAGALIGLAVVTWNFSRASVEAASFVNHTHQVIAEIGALEAQLYAAEADQRAYIVTIKPAFLSSRDHHVDQLRVRIDQLAQLIGDNPTQGARLAALRPAVEQRIQLMQETQQNLNVAVPVSVPERLDEGQRQLDAIQPLLTALSNEERRLLQDREQTEGRRRSDAVLVFGLLLAAIGLLLPLTFWRLAADLAARRRAEAEVAEERAFDSLHTRALMLYNSPGMERAPVLDQTLALLDESGRFPASVFYGGDEWSDKLRKLSARGAPSDVRDVVGADDGLIGTAVRGGRLVCLDRFDAVDGLRIETGLATLNPAAMLCCPVSHQGKLHGVLVLAAAVRPAPRDKAFVERLAAQLAVALHNLIQLEGLNLLADELRQRGQDIAQKNAALERASRMKSEFLANMSHELRTPLNAVIGFSEILRDGLAGDLTKEQTEYVGDIYTSGNHLLALINDVLDLSKIEAGQMELELSEMAPADLVVAGVSVIRERAAARRIQIIEVCPPHLGRLCVDARRAKQIVYNLLSNAEKFTPDDGSVTVSVQQVERGRIDAAREAEDRRVFAPPPSAHDGMHEHFAEIMVRDSGIGIEAEALRALFQPFMQVDSALNRHYEGTGLGLTMVQRLAELHGGGLMVESRPGEGSTFTVWLPWRQPKAPALDLSPPPQLPLVTAAPSDPQAVRIMVIEDDPRAANLMRLQLEPHGYRVDVASNAEHGLAQVIDAQPDAVVLDVVLPGMDGWDMLARLKEHAATRHIPVVIVSITDEPRRGFVLGASQVLVKPVSQDELLAALDAMGMTGPLPEGKRVLVVDDDPKAVTLVCKHLASAGFETLSAYGGQEALQLVRSERPDLIVLDLMMPHVSGFDVVEALGREPSTAGIGILVLTAKLVTAKDREQLRGRVQRILEKASFQPASLLAEVRRALVKRPAVIR